MLCEHRDLFEAVLVKRTARCAGPPSTTLALNVMEESQSVRGMTWSRYSPISLAVTLILGMCGRQDPINAIPGRQPSSQRPHLRASRAAFPPRPKSKRALDQADTGLEGIHYTLDVKHGLRR